MDCRVLKKEAALFRESSVAVFNSSHLYVPEDLSLHIIILFLSLVVLLEQALTAVHLTTHPHPYPPPRGLVAIPVFNPLTLNDHYSGRTAPLTSKVAYYIFIQQI